MACRPTGCRASTRPSAARSDFKFRNTTGNWLLIRANGDTKNLTVKL